MQNISEFPFCETHASFFDESGRRESRPQNLLTKPSAPDEAAVFSLLQFGAIIPPLSPWQGIQRFLPGYRYAGTQVLGPLAPEESADITALRAEEQADEIERRLDLILHETLGDCEEPALLFSGGVDSGLIAARLAALGYRKSLLLNYSFHEHDPESELAEAMAQRLGLRFERVSAQCRLCECLERPGRIYPMPFCDHSVAPTSAFAQAIIERLGGEQRLIIDGFGPDSFFGMQTRIRLWNQLSRLPGIARSATSLLYGATFWRKTGACEHILRLVRRSADMPALSAAIAQNPLAGIMYRDASRDAVDRSLAAWIEGWAGTSFPRRLVAADLGLACVNTFAQKTQSVFEAAGHRVAHPFFHDAFVSLGMASVSHWDMSEPKAPLKLALERCVPPQMVYRAKSGFVDPQSRVFFDPQFIAYLRAAAEDSAPLAFILKKKPLLNACDLLSRQKTLPFQTLNCLWAITFADRWYRTARF